MVRRSILWSIIVCALVNVAACASDRTDRSATSEVSAPSDAHRSPGASGTTRLPTSGACTPKGYDFPRDLYPFEDHCPDLGFGDYHYLDESPGGTPKGTVLMVHGNPTSSFVYRDVARDLLGRGYRVVAVDHYGFGLSAKPPVETFGYRPSDHSDVLTSFVDALDLRNVTLLVQDWGGPVGLAMAVARPDRVKNLLIMNTWAWQVTEADADGVYGSLARWSIQNHQPAGRAAADAGLTVTGAALTLAASHPDPPRQAVRDAYEAPFFDPTTGQVRPGSTEPTFRFAQGIFDDTEIFDRLGTLAPIADKPVFFYFGGADPLFGALTPNPDGRCADGSVVGGQPGCRDSDGELIYPFIDQFTELWDAGAVRGVEVNDEAGHFVQEQSPGRVAEIVAERLG